MAPKYHPVRNFGDSFDVMMQTLWNCSVLCVKYVRAVHRLICDKIITEGLGILGPSTASRNLPGYAHVFTIGIQRYRDGVNDSLQQYD